MLIAYGVREKTLEEVAGMRSAKMDAIKAEAERRILAIMTEQQQRNTLALGIEFITAHGADPAAWPAARKAIFQAAMTQWAAIKALRARSNALEAQIPRDAAGIAAFDPMQGWN